MEVAEAWRLGISEAPQACRRILGSGRVERTADAKLQGSYDPTLQVAQTTAKLRECGLRMAIAKGRRPRQFDL